MRRTPLRKPGNRLFLVVRRKPPARLSRNLVPPGRYPIYHLVRILGATSDRMGLFVRTIGLKRADAKIGLANLAYNFLRLIFHERRAAMA